MTVLADRLFRLEEDISHIFCDEATEAVWFRDMPPVPFTKAEKGGRLHIITEKATLVVGKTREECHVLLAGDEIALDNKGNLGGTYTTLDNCDGDLTKKDREGTLYEPISIDMGVVSKSGVAVLDYSESAVLTAEGLIRKREHGSLFRISIRLCWIPMKRAERSSIRCIMNIPRRMRHTPAPISISSAQSSSFVPSRLRAMPRVWQKQRSGFPKENGRISLQVRPMRAAGSFPWCAGWDSIPVLAKAGGILVLDAGEHTNDISAPDYLRVMVMNGNGCYTLREDGASTVFEAEAEENKQTLTIRSEGTLPRKMTVELRNIKAGEVTYAYDARASRDARFLDALTRLEIPFDRKETLWHFRYLEDAHLRAKIMMDVSLSENDRIKLAEPWS